MNLKNLFSLEDKVIIVTGALGLLGRKHAEAIAAYGGNPILIDLSKSKTEQLANSLNKKFGVKSSGYKVDITKEAQIIKNVKALQKKYQKIDGLVNNASSNPTFNNKSTSKLTRLEEFPLELWNKDISVGLTGSFLCSKNYGNCISKNKNGGVIVNISSDLAIISPDQRLYKKKGLSDDEQPVKPISYSIVKTGLIGLTMYLSTYWAKQKVRCNAICPGGVEDDQPKEFINSIKKLIPLNRMARKNEYQGTLIWMLSDASSYLNGAVIPVDGGRSVL